MRKGEVREGVGVMGREGGGWGEAREGVGVMGKEGGGRSEAREGVGRGVITERVGQTWPECQ